MKPRIVEYTETRKYRFTCAELRKLLDIEGDVSEVSVIDFSSGFGSVDVTTIISKKECIPDA